MAEATNIRIVTNLGELAYRSAEELGIVFNRIVDDMQEIDNRFQDFSFDFELPFVRENSLVFGAPEGHGRKRIFPPNQNIPCRVYLNDTLLLDGLINLEAVTQTGYKCKLYSKFKELIDILNEPNEDGSDKTLRDLQFPVIEDWHYENTLIAHQQAEYKDSDETFYQYPFSFYSTYYTEYAVYKNIKKETQSRPPYMQEMRADNSYQNYYYFINTNYTGDTAGITGNTWSNRVYIHQVPPCVYLVSIVKQILQDAGFQLGGQFFENESLKKIVLLYAGDEDIYDQATERVSGSTALNLQIAKFLPEMNQAEFLKSVINMFNLYIKMDETDKVITFETYNTLFGDSFNPYDITNKIDVKTLDFYYEQNNNPTIRFEPANSQNIMGDNMIMTGYTNNATEQKWVKCSKLNYNSFFNRLGTTDTIDIDFSEPTIKRIFMWNDFDILFTIKGTKTQTIYLPNLSKQTPTDNDSKRFNANTGDTYLFNTENSIKFSGKPCLMYYYGRATNEFENKAGKGYLRNYMYYNMPSETGTTINRIPIPVVSPFQLYNYREPLIEYMSGMTVNDIEDRRTTTATYLQTLWQLMGNDVQIPSDLTTDFSLVFDDNGYFHDTLWTKFHRLKYDRYQNSEILEADMRMNAVDWNEMQIERPIMYNKEIYNIVAIEGYNPITKTARIRLIKKL